jgi:hypothetical protein
MRTINLRCGDGLYRVLNDRENLEYPLILIFNNEEFTVNNSEELEANIKEVENLCNNKGQKLIDNTKIDLFN